MGFLVGFYSNSIISRIRINIIIILTIITSSGRDPPSRCTLHLVRPFPTRIFFQELSGLEGQKKSWGQKKLSYEEIFPKKSLAKNLLRKKKLEYSQPRKFLAQNFPEDKRNFYEELKSVQDEAYLPSTK